MGDWRRMLRAPRRYRRCKFCGGCRGTGLSWYGWYRKDVGHARESVLCCKRCADRGMMKVKVAII